MDIEQEIKKLIDRLTDLKTVANLATRRHIDRVIEVVPYERDRQCAKSMLSKIVRAVEVHCASDTDRR